MRLLYNVAAVLVVILMIPAFCIRAIREKGFVNRIKQQLGFLPKHALDKVARKNCIWVHAASVGEIVAASPLIKEFRREFPNTPILVSVFTNSGYEMANRIIKDADSIIHFPFDLCLLEAFFNADCGAILSETWSMPCFPQAVDGIIYGMGGFMEKHIL